MPSDQIRIIDRSVKAIEHRYNAENDIIPGAPAVTWADNELLEIIKHLVIVAEYLQDQIDQLKRLQP